MIQTPSSSLPTFDLRDINTWFHPVANISLAQKDISIYSCAQTILQYVVKTQPISISLTHLQGERIPRVQNPYAWSAQAVLEKKLFHVFIKQVLSGRVTVSDLQRVKTYSSLGLGVIESPPSHAHRVDLSCFELYITNPDAEFSVYGCVNYFNRKYTPFSQTPKMYLPPCEVFHLYQTKLVAGRLTVQDVVTIAGLSFKIGYRQPTGKRHASNLLQTYELSVQDSYAPPNVYEFVNSFNMKYAYSGRPPKFYVSPAKVLLISDSQTRYRFPFMVKESVQFPVSCVPMKGLCVRKNDRPVLEGVLCRKGISFAFLHDAKGLIRMKHSRKVFLSPLFFSFIRTMVSINTTLPSTVRDVCDERWVFQRMKEWILAALQVRKEDQKNICSFQSLVALLGGREISSMRLFN